MVLSSFLVILLLSGHLPALSGADAVPAQRLLQAGRYEEALEQYAQIAKTKPIGAALGAAECLDALGRWARRSVSCSRQLES